MQKAINIGIIGYGVIGKALTQWLIKHNPICSILISDPPKNYNDNMYDADIFFINLHIPTKNDGMQNLDLLKHIIVHLPNKPIFIRTTLIPGTCDRLCRELEKKIYFMPEFCSERTAYEDFCPQPMIFCGEIELLKQIFIGKQYEIMTSLEAEIAKYAHNVFGALKVTFFNGICDLATQMGGNYENVRKGFLLSKYINPTHTIVPGIDGKFGYGGKCFPKDVCAFEKITEKMLLNNMIKSITDINNYYRNKNEI